MPFALTETQALVQRTARDFGERVLRPDAADIDATGRFPREALRAMADLGLLGIQVPEAYGGAAAGPIAFSLAIEEIARACASTAVTASVTNMVAETIARFGTDAQRARYLPAIARGDHVAASFALSEADAGSDPAALRTTARRDADGWVLDGSKQWITSGAYAGVLVVWARTAPADAGARGLSCFLVDGGTPGLRVGRPEDKMGLRGSSTVPLEFAGCRLPQDALLGELHGGFKVAMMALDGGRIGIASQALGIAQAALDASVAYAKQRSTFGVPIGHHQAIAFKLADMGAQIDAARLLVRRAAHAKERGRPFTREASMAKLFASEAAVQVCNDAVQIHGGYGYARDFPVERYLRDARVTTIYEGTSEIQRSVIARAVLST
ncbi:MAG: acyl-CoA dehydrogenase family protein [Polyangiaceae bacterium]|nr:acyl-CoA dehydrogenase family protein [Polyangiaceae bacterium]